MFTPNELDLLYCSVCNELSHCRADGMNPEYIQAMSALVIKIHAMLPADSDFKNVEV